jgi:hypothetical protein
VDEHDRRPLAGDEDAHANRLGVDETLLEAG